MRGVYIDFIVYVSHYVMWLQPATERRAVARSPFRKLFIWNVAAVASSTTCARSDSTVSVILWMGSRANFPLRGVHSPTAKKDHTRAYNGAQRSPLRVLQIFTYVHMIRPALRCILTVYDTIRMHW